MRERHQKVKKKKKKNFCGLGFPLYIAERLAIIIIITMVIVEKEAKDPNKGSSARNMKGCFN